MFVELKRKSQVTIPSKLVKKLNLQPGDLLKIEEIDEKIVITPVVAIPKEQLWFYSPEWQREEAILDKNIKEGKVKATNSKEELFKELGLEDK
ncbi:AbrB/MazE/SpoVT family DNA-binding domain-containing protein [Caldanaerobacter subterraneus]|uniref:AbrB family transcriptional regulator n=2 Tax=Caldanaerobacter subterraneus TaxID=911092 RepID=U5CJ44_CALSX|nr:AbrB/MazE/SpoVT family DNA-binding domain-containing protein [Caldanaerobacter subterraneus]ERM92945.1 AbrB family transcriptional regulator [Caldanaerobacter subterraneus subsp. yonseiensis KB-1]NNG66879.1 AbrB/MazE/SpoVT family DNA-binding domain-containing protein [Caldanaerobacter subterraneus]